MASNSSQQFRERLPVMLFPSGSQMFRRAFGEARVVKNDLGSGALLHQFEFRNRIHAGVPTAGSPRLHNALTRDEFDMSPRTYPPKRVNAPPTSRLICVGLLPRFCIDFITPLSSMTLS